MNPLSEARGAITAALEPLGVTIYGVPPNVVTPPAAVVVPADDWFGQSTFSSIHVDYQVTLMATMQGSNESALERLENLVWDARLALTPVGIIDGGQAPRVVTIGVTEVAAVDINIRILVTSTEGATT